MARLLINCNGIASIEEERSVCSPANTAEGGHSIVIDCDRSELAFFLFLELALVVLWDPKPCDWVPYPGSRCFNIDTSM